MHLLLGKIVNEHGLVFFIWFRQCYCFTHVSLEKVQISISKGLNIVMFLQRFKWPWTFYLPMKSLQTQLSNKSSLRSNSYSMFHISMYYIHHNYANIRQQLDLLFWIILLTPLKIVTYYMYFSKKKKNLDLIFIGPSWYFQMGCELVHFDLLCKMENILNKQPFKKT